MNNFKSYIPLINAWETYLLERKSDQLIKFAYWLIEFRDENKNQTKDDSNLEDYFNLNSREYNFSFQSSEAAFLIWRLSKFIRHYVKPILSDKGLSSQDDFAILAHIDYLKVCSKKQAVEANIIELTTGIEIIKRLIKQKLIQEKENKEDKRQKLISLTKKGKNLLKEIYFGFSSIQDILADMNKDDRVAIIEFLKRLDSYHSSNIKLES